MTIVKHSWLDVPRWCKVIHYDGDRVEDILKYVLLSLGVKTWQKDIELDNFVQDINPEEYMSVDKNKKIGFLDARGTKNHKGLIKAVKLINKLGLVAFVHTNLSEETDKCMGKNHIKITTVGTTPETSSVQVSYTHLKHGYIHKEYTLKHTDDNLELVHLHPLAIPVETK
jgi:hypothetical protein